MTRSMTGFATKLVPLSREDGSRASLSISLKSLNSRFFEFTCRLPYQLNHLETELAQIVKKSLYRGHVFLTVNIDNKTFFKGSIDPSLSIVQGYTEAINQIKKGCNVQGEFTLSDIVHLPDIFITEEKTIDENTKQIIITAVTDLAHDIIIAQQEEGDLLANDILERIAIMETEIQKISITSDISMKKQKEKITLTLQEIEDDESKKTELHKHATYALLDKMDIHEEIIRFNSHLNNLKIHVTSNKIEKGKRLDFTLQELAREINTIAAKCSDAAIGSMAIDIKVELEKAREQTQNIV